MTAQILYSNYTRACAQNCAIEDVNYASTYKREQERQLACVLDGQRHQYEMFKLLNKEFTFNVDVSKLPNSLNAALYFSKMEMDGATGIQCLRDIKLIQNEANVARGNPSDSHLNARAGSWGACCNEMDIWEANSISTAYTPHPCTAPSLTHSTGALGRYDTVCDPDSCDFNSFCMARKASMARASPKSTTGDLKDISHMCVQDGKVSHNSKVNIPGVPAYDSITTEFCNAQKVAFDDDSFKAEGGM
ncbi:concanavalin A-like lectin/glucanase domain-containing protein [Crucibulum laeve]|uniref:Glucanase n=1 Tax=Crucibulum laeve TaxID=68775 RepID=A0A5C3LQM5_9AGAR|nr:concanavalin A-like lectin/glucanase domain-containing protein [Crucibulum laeve]